MGAGDGAPGGRKLKFKIIIDGTTLSGSVKKCGGPTQETLVHMCGVTVHDVDWVLPLCMFAKGNLLLSGSQQKLASYVKHNTHKTLWQLLWPVGLKGGCFRARAPARYNG